MSTITRGATTVTPDLIEIGSYATGTEVATIEHKIIARPDPDYTLVGASPRSGTLVLFFATESVARAADALHRAAGPLDLLDTVRPAASMRYIVFGTLALELDSETRDRWLLRVPYREVRS